MATNTFKRKTYRPQRRLKLGAIMGNLDMSVLMKNMPFIVFLCFLGIIYIANSHFAVRTIRQINALQEELKRVSWENNASRSELMHNAMQSEIARRVSAQGLREHQDAPRRLKIND